MPYIFVSLGPTCPDRARRSREILLFFLFAFIIEGHSGLLCLSCHLPLLVVFVIFLFPFCSSSSSSLPLFLFLALAVSTKRSVYVIHSIIVFYVNKRSTLWFRYLGRNPRNRRGWAGWPQPASVKMGVESPQHQKGGRFPRPVYHRGEAVFRILALLTKSRERSSENPLYGVAY